MLGLHVVMISSLYCPDYLQFNLAQVQIILFTVALLIGLELQL